MLSKEEINEAYRFVLGRAPESESVIRDWQDRGIGADGLTDMLVRSHEFRNAYFDKIFPDRSIVFIHIPKTAGTALRENWLLKNIIGERYWYDMPGHRVNWEKLQSDPFVASTHRLIGGHLPIADFIGLNIVQPKTYLSVIRTPIDRAISYFNFIKASKKHPLAPLLQGKTLLEAVRGQDEFGQLIASNQQLTYLFDSAKTIAEEDKLIIGKQEFVSDFIGTCNDELSFTSVGDGRELGRENVGQSTHMKERIREEGFDEALALLANILAREIDFYHSFDRVLNLNASQYEQVRGVHNRTIT